MNEFRDQCRRRLNRNLDSRIKYGFFRTYRPVKDDEPVRVFEKMSDYRIWADLNLPRYLGYKVVTSDASERIAEGKK